MIRNNSEALNKDTLWEEIKRIFRFIFSSDDDVGKYAHPSLKKRLKELSVGRKWGLKEYCRYAIEMLLNMITGEGTRL